MTLYAAMFTIALWVVWQISDRYNVLRVTSASMVPTYCIGDILLIRAMGTRSTSVGQSVIFVGDHGRQVVKRVVATAGHTVVTNSDFAIVDGKRVEEHYLCGPRDSSGGLARSHLLAPRGSVFVKPGQVFVMGDNRAFSNDSRDYGPVEIGRISAGVVASFRWPGGSSLCNCSSSK